MKKISKILAVVLCLTMAVSMLVVGASAANEKAVDLTAESLGLGAYGVGTATVDGVAFEWTELGSYGYGTQMRIKNGNTASLWNTSAFEGGITKIELTLNSDKKVYDNADAVIFNFGNSAQDKTYSTKLSTVADTRTYTITPDADTYTYFYMVHNITYTLYLDSIKVYYNEAAAEIETNYYVAGVSALCGSNWEPADSANVMTKGASGLYTKTYENVAAGEYELKVTAGNWENCWGTDGNNYKFTTEAVSNVTVIFNAETKAVSVEIVPVAAPSIVDIKTAVDAESGDFTVKGVVTCIDGKNLYVQDATGGICVRMNENVSDVELGDTVIAGGSKSVYNGMPQLGNGSYEKSEGVELSAKETTIDALTTADLCAYVKLCGVTITEIFDNDGAYTIPNVTVSDGTNTIQIYKCAMDKNEDGTWAFAVGDKIDVLAAVGCFKETLQLRNTLASEITICNDSSEEPENPENPEDPEIPEEEIPKTADVSVLATVLVAACATTGLVVLTKKEQF